MENPPRENIERLISFMEFLNDKNKFSYVLRDVLFERLDENKLKLSRDYLDLWERYEKVVECEQRRLLGD